MWTPGQRQNWRIGRFCPYLEWILLQFMDGSAHPVGRDSAVYRLVLSVIEIPAHLLPGNMDMKKADLCLRCYFDRRRRRSPAVDFISAFGALPFLPRQGAFFVLLKRKTTACPLDKRRPLCYPFVT